MWYVYILESLVDGDYYKGYSQNYLNRLAQHNNGESKFTSIKKPWKLIFVQEFEDKSLAIKREKQLKKCNKLYLQWLVEQSCNILKKLDR
jgi:putative endonuclease